MSKTVKKEEVTEISPQNSEKDTLASIMKEFKDEHENYTERVLWKVSTGSLLLDVATGGITPSLWRLCGQNNSGKTPQSLEIIRNMFNGLDKCKAIWVLAEGRGLSTENKERCGLKFVYKPEEWDNHTVFVLESNIFELVIRTFKDLVINNPNNFIYAFVIDSIDGLTLRDDAKKEITENNRVAGVPALSKKMMQSISLKMFKYGHWMGLISQVTAEIKVDQYAPSANRGGKFSGGNSLLHGSDYIIQYEQPSDGDFIIDNNSGKFNDGKSKPIGQNVKISFVKSGKEISKKRKMTYPIKYGKKLSAIWKEREIVDILLGWGIAKRSGAWIAPSSELVEELNSVGLDIPLKIQGIDNFYKLLEENTGLCDYLFKKLESIMS